MPSLIVKQEPAKTSLIGWVANPLNLEAIEQDIFRLKSLPSIHAFSDYWVGTVRVYTLWNLDGNSKNGYYSEYAGAATLTETGSKLHRIKKIIEDTFYLKYLKFARIFELENGGFLLPHRDFLELENGFSRLNIPIKTNDQCFYSEDLVVYHMRFGEVWFVNNGKKVHSAINLSSQSRLHLILDFDNNIPLENLFKDKSAMKPPMKPKLIERESLTEASLKNIYNLNGIISNHNLQEIVSILGKIHFHKKTSPELTYTWLESIAEMTGDSALIKKSQKIKKFFIGPMKSSPAIGSKSIWFDD